MSDKSDNEIIHTPGSSVQNVVHKKSRSKSFMWEHFEKVGTEKANCKCIHCKFELKIKYGSRGKRHIKSSFKNNIHI